MPGLFQQLLGHHGGDDTPLLDPTLIGDGTLTWGSSDVTPAGGYPLPLGGTHVGRTSPLSLQAPHDFSGKRATSFLARAATPSVLSSGWAGQEDHPHTTNGKTSSPALDRRTSTRRQRGPPKQQHFTDFLLRFYSKIDKADATSTYSEGGEEDDTFSAEKALSLGSGYWCSAGKHPKDDAISFVGSLKHRKKISGVKVRSITIPVWYWWSKASFFYASWWNVEMILEVNWAYSPGEVQVRTSPDGEHWLPVVKWHQVPRMEVSFEQ